MADSDLTPSARIIKKSNEIKTTKDSLGRVITYKTLKPSDQLEMVGLIGVDKAVNPITISMCSAAYRATSIDGIPLFPPESYKELIDTMDQLDDEGLSALYAAFRGPVDSPVVTKEETKKAK